MSIMDNWLHFPDKILEIKIYGMSGTEKALNRIADELEKSNNYTGKHKKTEESE